MYLVPVIFALACCISHAVCNRCMRNGVTCLNYNVTSKFPDYEVRSYPSFTWISSSANATLRKNVSRQLIKLLYGYLDGENEKGVPIARMLPYRTKKVAGGQTNSYTISIPIQIEDGAQPPKPSNPSVTIHKEEPTSYVVRSFDGMIKRESEWDAQAEALKRAVSNDNKVSTGFYYWSVYDPPWREDNRLNEVWMIKSEA